MLSGLLRRRGYFSVRGRALARYNSSQDGVKVTEHPISQGHAKLSVTSISDEEIAINNITTRQSVILFPKSFYLWKARVPDDITLSSLALIPIIFPTLEMLLIGCGNSFVDPEKARDLSEEFRSKGIVLEFMSSRYAATTFNILNDEERHVGAALLLADPNWQAMDEHDELLKELTNK